MPKREIEPERRQIDQPRVRRPAERLVVGQQTKHWRDPRRKRVLRSLTLPQDDSRDLRSLALPQADNTCHSTVRTTFVALEAAERKDEKEQREAGQGGE